MDKDSFYRGLLCAAEMADEMADNPEFISVSGPQALKICAHAVKETVERMKNEDARNSVHS